jgi:hypothetical protein
MYDFGVKLNSIEAARGVLDGSGFACEGGGENPKTGRRQGDDIPVRHPNAAAVCDASQDL